MAAPSRSLQVRRKLVEFRAEILQALELLAMDQGGSVQALADEAFLDLLRKYHRPVSLKEALRESARRLPANDDVPPPRHGT
ncbi:MAG: ribbon-helix-helix domain-containing protein [Methyloceanibacter sp.]